MEELFASTCESCYLVLVGGINLALAVEVGFNLCLDGLAVEVIGHELLINRPILQIVMILGTAGAEESRGAAVV